MDRNFLKAYNTELSHIRQMAGEFAKEYPKIAGRLALDKDAKEICPDPFVERLLEGFAYLTARVQVKLDAEFPRLTQSILETTYPQYVAPVPSMAVIRFAPDYKNKALATGFPIPRGTTIRTAPVKGDRTNCTYRTAHDITLWPVQLAETHYLDRSILSLELPREASPAAAVQMVFKTTADLSFNETDLDALTFFLRGADSLPATLMEHLFAHTIGVWARDPDDKESGWHRLPAGCLEPVGLANNESLIPPDARTFEGYRLLMEYFAFPQRFRFFRIKGLRDAVRSCRSSRLELAIGLSMADPKLAPRVNPSMFDLFCTPVVNLFEKRTDRINMTKRFSEYHLVVDRSRPLDYEIFSIESVTGYGTRSGEEQQFYPFYLSGDINAGHSAYFTVHRKERTLTEKERRYGRLSSYHGSEAFISLVDANSAPYSSDLQQLGIAALCTNRHLPIRMSQGDRAADFLLEINGPVEAAQCISGPTTPRGSFAIGEIAWRLISHLSLNYFSLVDSSSGDGAAAMRELLGLYTDPNDRSAQLQIQGLHSVECTPILRRVPSVGMITFARGIEVKVLFDEDAFTGTGIFILGMVLDQFFSKHAAINSFTETVICSKQRGEIIRWPARTGRKQIL